MKLMSLKQYMNMSKPALIRKITMTLRKMPKKKLAILCYNITKLKLTELKTIKGGRMIIQDIRRKRQVGSLLYEGYEKLSPQTAHLYATTKRLRQKALPKRKYESQHEVYYRRTKKRKFSKKQLAAQRLFAKRARAGTLRRR